MKNLSTPARVYVLGVIIAGGILAAILPQLPGAAPRLDLPFAVFVAAALLTQLVGVRVIMPGREGIAWSLINAVIVATVLLFPAGNSILLVLITFTAYGFKRRELPWYQGAFNVAQHVLSVSMAEAVWAIARPESISGAMAVQWYGAAFFAGVVFYVFNGALVTLAITLVAGKPFGQVGVISRSSFYREMVLIWLGAAVADFWIVNPWRTVLLTLPLVGLSQMLRMQIEDAERIRRSQQEAEGRAQQLASLNELARALTSSLELQQIYEALYAQVRTIVPADAFGAGVYESHSNLIRFGLWRTEDETFPPFSRNASEPIFRRVLQARTPLALEAGPDHAEIAQLSQYGRLHRDAMAVAIPMTVGDRAVGMIIVGTRRVLTPQEMDLLSTMASQTAVAVEKAQLFDRERRKSAQLGAITQVSKKIVTIHSVDVLLQQTSRLIEEAFDFERVQLLLADEAETSQADPAATGIPILYRGQSIGDLRVWLRPGTSFSPDDLSMLQTLADEIAVAIENARLYENLQRQMAMLEQTQFQLMQSAKLATIGELAAFVAHEINNPLTSVLGYASLILSETPPDDAKRGDLEVIEKEALRARAIVRDLLGYARQTDSAMEQTSINEAIESVLPLIRRRAESQRVNITANLDPSVPKIMGDINQLKQVFINILNNAIDAMPAGGAVDIRTREVTGNGTGPQVEISFQDGGVGISEDKLERIFDPFFTTKEDGKGTGLGLPISKRIVERHGGSIAVKSTLGTGTRFTVCLPVAVTYS
ncbi:MAG: GAF domain-containing protein [Bacillati bacterium ANGP1]|uniref:histidine kinase n=1 Tax=Candidatus Segetimicrobium genomatis TaxID=2569760 RepID=A0A537KUQ7_9BACT|nr:MAG: GAF domain-containing protein [Terrabacteria group bacterium ANGP1]